MKKKIRLRFNTVLMMLVAILFFALGLTFLIIIIKELFTTGNFLWPISIFMVPALVISSIFLKINIKEIIHFVKGKMTEKCGEEGFCKIIESKCASINYKNNNFYSLKLSYIVNGEERISTTDYLFDQNEYNYLRCLKKIKILHRKGYAVIAETFF